MQSRIDRVSDRCMRWWVHRAFRRRSFEFGRRTCTRLDSNSCVDNNFFFVFWVWTRRPRPIFLSSNSLSAPQVRLTSTYVGSSISPPRNHAAFSLAKQVSFEHSLSSPSLLSLREGKKNIQTNDKQMTRQKVSPSFVVDRSSARPDRDSSQCCSAAT